MLENIWDEQKFMGKGEQFILSKYRNGKEYISENALLMQQKNKMEE